MIEATSPSGDLVATVTNLVQRWVVLVEVSGCLYREMSGRLLTGGPSGAELLCSCYCYCRRRDYINF